MDLSKSVSDSVSKYNNLRHKMSVMLRHGILKNLEAVWTLSYQDRLGEVIQYNSSEKDYYSIPYKPYWLLDGSVNWKIRKIALFVTLTNMLNTEYIDAGTLNQPGRWLRAGVTLNLEKKQIE
jgi:iron complex outermembrane receptor protein